MLYFNNKAYAQVTIPNVTKVKEIPTLDKNYLYFQNVGEVPAGIILEAYQSFDISFEISFDGIVWESWQRNSSGGNFSAINLTHTGDYVFIRATSNNIWQNSVDKYLHFSMSGSAIECGGSIMSLISKTASQGATMASYIFYKLFSGCLPLLTPPELPSTVISEYCYRNMFYDCINLQYSPDLPAKDIAQGAYTEMFNGCSSLKKAGVISGTSFGRGSGSYDGQCTRMFANCSSLEYPPELPATNLNSISCYYEMFKNCINLKKGVDLSHVTALSTASGGSLGSMYSGCSKLSVAYAPNVSTWNTSYANNWLSNVALSGVLYKPPTLDIPTNNASGVPNGWTTAVYTKTITLSAKGSGEVGFSYSINGGTSVTLNTGDEISITIEMPQTLSVTTPSYLYPLLSDGEVIGVPPICELSYANIKNGCILTSKNVLTNENMLSFTANTAGSKIGMTHDGTNANTTKPVVYISTDNKSTWSLWDYKNNITLQNQGDTVYMFGYNTTGISKSTSNYSKFTMSGSIACDGDIMSLCYGLGGYKIPSSYCFYDLFYDCESLTAAPELSATTLADNCYREMFYGCTSLTTAPELPAETLATQCYSYMFRGCTGLTMAPELPATNLTNASNCYYQMFRGCTGLTTAPELPATTLANQCYYQMFYGCTSLTTPPTLPATTLASGCYQQMFNGCSNLVLPQGYTLPAETLATQCYYQMFYNCSKVDHIRVYATAWETTSASDWLYGVSETGTLEKSSLVTIPIGTSGIPSGWNAYNFNGYLTFTANTAGSTIGMTHNGTNTGDTKPVIYISSDKENWAQWDFSTITLANVGDRVYMYGNNPNGVSRSTSNWSRFTMTGSIAASGDCTTLVSEDGVTSLSSKYYCFYGMFQGCTSLTMAPSLPATNITNATGCYRQMFYGCTSLTTAPELPATTLAVHCYNQMFYECTSLTVAPELPATTLASSCYNQMFEECTSLINVPSELPATTLANACYNYMFYGCTSLTAAPELPAETLVSQCYQGMFNGCTKLNYIKVGATSWNTSNATSWLYNVSATGTFIKPSATVIETGASGIPSGWTVVDL